jgi:hypothetical protein
MTTTTTDGRRGVAGGAGGAAAAAVSAALLPQAILSCACSFLRSADMAEYAATARAFRNAARSPAASPAVIHWTSGPAAPLVAAAAAGRFRRSRRLHVTTDGLHLDDLPALLHALTSMPSIPPLTSVPPSSSSSAFLSVHDAGHRSLFFFALNTKQALS